MKVRLFFPPATDPRGPHLALPALAACLRHAGHDVVQRDLDLEGLLALLRPERLEAAVTRLRSGVGEHLEPGRVAALRRLSEGLVERTVAAVRTLRDPVRFYDANDFSAARAVVDTAVAVASAAAPVPVHYSLEPIRYDVEGCDVRRLGDLIRVAAQQGCNLFHDFWEDEVLAGVDADAPELIGVSLTNRQQVIPGLALARRLKQRGHFVVLGGTFITKFAEDLARVPEFFETFADGVVVFEGETALLELLEQLRAGHHFSRVPNYRYLAGGTVRATSPHVETVDALPTPDFSGLLLDDYLAPRPVLPILFGKGCYHARCGFCDIPHSNRVSQSRYRRRSPARILEDVRGLEKRFGARHFVVTDESLSPAVLGEIADAFSGHLGRYSFAGYARLEGGFTPEFCGRIAELGVRKLAFGLESASQRTLDHMGKGTEVAAAPAVLRACRDAGIRFHLFSMIGLPEEDEDSARETLAFFLEHRDLIDHPGNSFDIHRFGLDVRSRYFAERERYGLQVADEAGDGDFVIGIDHGNWRNTRGMSPERVEGLLLEFRRALLSAYAPHHAAPRQLWPSFEEHAVLYADHYRSRTFPFGSAAPVEGDPRRFRIRWSPACDVGEGDAGVMVTTPWDTFGVPAPLARVLAEARSRTLREVAEDCVGNAPEDIAAALGPLREAIFTLIAGGALQLEWSDIQDASKAEAGALGVKP